MKRRRRTTGQGMIEAVTAAVVLIPLALFLLDFMVLVIANQTNDSLAKAAARAGASQTIDTYHAAVVSSLASFHPSPIITNLELYGLDYDESVKGACVVSTRIKVHFPMPIPGFADMTFAAKAVEPITNFKPPDLINP